MKLDCSISESVNNSFDRNKRKKKIVLDCKSRRSSKHFFSKMKKIEFDCKPRQSGKHFFANKKRQLFFEQLLGDLHVIAQELFFLMMLWQSVKQDNIRQKRQLMATAKILKNNELLCNPRHCGRNLCGEMNRKQRKQLDFKIRQ